MIMGHPLCSNSSCSFMRVSLCVFSVYLCLQDVYLLRSIAWNVFLRAAAVSGICHRELWGVTECVEASKEKLSSITCPLSSTGEFGRARTKLKNLSRLTESCFDSLMSKLCLCVLQNLLSCETSFSLWSDKKRHYNLKAKVENLF